MTGVIILSDDKKDSTGIYITDFKNHQELIEKISPYHFYLYNYFHLRKKWRDILYDWTRRESCDAKAEISPESVVAGRRQTVTITLTMGETPLGRSGRIALYFPLSFGGFLERTSLMCFQGPDGKQGYGSRIVAKAENSEVQLRTVVHSTGSVFTSVEIIVLEGTLQKDDKVDIIIGDPSNKPQVINERAKTYPMRLAIDYTGDGVFLPVKPYPEIRVVGNKALYFNCFAPATPKIGEPFDLKVIAADHENHNPSYTYHGKVLIEAVSGVIDGPGEAVFEQEWQGKGLIRGFKSLKQGVSRIQVIDRENALIGISNPVCPEAAPEGMSLYYGEIHSHTDLSDGLGTTEDNFVWARDVEGLDFAALADHFEDSQSYNYTIKDKWEMTKEAVRRFNEPGSFVTLLGYEIGTVEQHRNVYFEDDEGRMIVEGPGGETVTMDNVFEKLEGTEYLLIPHAPKFHGINWHRPHRPDRQRLVEICSFWGISEEGGPLSVRHALNMGYKFGFTGGTDNHVAEPGNPNMGGITGVYAKSLTRKDIFEGLISRRTFATTGPRMIITFYVNNTLMGDECSLSPGDGRVISGRVVTCDRIEKIEIVRNGETAYVIDGKNANDLTVQWEDTDPLEALAPTREITEERFTYYYLRIQTVNGDFGWSSPVWVHLKDEL
jgi:hypothetical protein